MLDGLSGLFSSRVRLDVVAALLSGPKSFTTLKQLTGATDGNLGRQLEVLVQAGAVAGERALVGKRGRTTYSLTPSGRAGFRAYVEALEALLAQGEEQQQE